MLLSWHSWKVYLKKRDLKGEHDIWLQDILIELDIDDKAIFILEL